MRIATTHDSIPNRNMKGTTGQHIISVIWVRNERYAPLYLQHHLDNDIINSNTVSMVLLLMVSGGTTGLPK